jgi:hypothetical protein
VKAPAALLLGLVLSAAASAPGEGLRAGEETVRWSFDSAPGATLEDARGGVPLSEALVGWRQLFGKEADPSAPELYSRHPEARIVHRAEGEPRTLELRTHGGRVLIASTPRALPALPRFRLVGSADLSGLGSGLLRITLQFLGSDAASIVGEEAVDVSRRKPIALEGEVPAGAAHAALRLSLSGHERDPVAAVVLERLDLELSPGLRISAGRGLPIFDEGEVPRIEVAAEGVERGAHRLEWTLSRSWLASGCWNGPGHPLDPVLETGPLLLEGTRVTVAPAGRPARWQVVLDEGHPLRPGGYLLTLRAADPRGATLERDVLFAVTPLSPWAPRDAWKRLREKLLSAPGPLRYAGALGFDHGPDRPTDIHAFVSPIDPGEARLLAVTARGREWIASSTARLLGESILGDAGRRWVPMEVPVLYRLGRNSPP